MKFTRRSIEIIKYDGDNLWQVSVEDINGDQTSGSFRNLNDAHDFVTFWFEFEGERLERKDWEARWIELSVAEDIRNGRTPILD